MRLNKKAKLSTVIAVTAICISLILVNGFIIVSTYLIGRSTSSGMEKFSETYSQDGVDFQYKGFEIRNLSYSIPSNFTIDCSNSSFASLAVDSVVLVDSNYSFYSCKLWIDGEVKLSLLESDMRKGGENSMTIPDVAVRRDHDIRLCCDNYCNGGTLSRLCREAGKT